MSKFDILWQKTCTIFPILKESLDSTELANDELQIVIDGLKKLDLCESIYESVWLEINRYVRTKTVPKFWSYFDRSDGPEKDFSKFKLAVYELREEYSNLEMIVRRLQQFKVSCLNDDTKKNTKMEFEEFTALIQSTLLSQLPPNMNDLVYSFYQISFKVFANRLQERDDFSLEIDEMNCNGCGKELNKCECKELVAAFNKTNDFLKYMNLLDRLAGYTFTSLIQERITSYVKDTCKGIFDTSHIDRLENWLESVVLNWLIGIYNQQSDTMSEEDKKTSDIVKDFKLKLRCYLYETYANIIIEQFFNIIIDYPDSQPAIGDLKFCMEKLELRAHLIKSLKHSLKTRLLHPGVNTMDILTGYVAAIKAIRHLDSSGVLLETITEPVKDYLRKRNDTVRRVVTGLTEEGPTDLAEELARSEALKENESTGENDMFYWANWKPDPVDANPVKTTRNNRSADIISMVVDIYGSKELFVNEYRNLLADRLLTQLDFNPEKEIRNLELLKLRFGETLLHSCEVMLKDISDSKRINSNIQSDVNYSNEKMFDISSLILSSQFWPALNKETLELPEEIQNEIKKYTTSYEALKGNRTLSWRPVTGRVLIEIQMADKPIEMSVTPTQAVIIYHFQNKSEWTLENLSSEMKVPASVLRKRLMFWQTHGLIKEMDHDVYVLIDVNSQTDVEEMQTHEICEDEDAESAMASASDQREEELQVFWSYIVGMLTNLDSLPIERIHQMLKMFASHGPCIEFSQEELKCFLQRKVREHKLIFASGVYHLPK